MAAVRTDKSYIRSVAVAAHESGTSSSEIANNFGVSSRTVRNWVAMSKNRPSLADLPRSGRPTKLNNEHKELIKRTLKSPGGSIRRAKRKLEELDLQVDPSTVWHAAKKMKLRKVKARKKPKLTQAQKQKRLDFAKSASKDPKYWKKILFADEKIFELQFGTKEAWIEEKEAVPLLPTVKFPSKIMVWGGISWYGKTKLIKIPSGLRMGAKEYIALVACHLPEAGRLIFGEKSSWKLVEDGAPSHRARVTQDWYSSNGVKVVSGFPPNSPDLNIIENAWKLIGDSVAARQPTTQDGLWRVVQEEWENLSLEKVQNLVLSVPDRLSAVTTSQGGNTKY